MEVGLVFNWNAGSVRRNQTLMGLFPLRHNLSKGFGIMSNIRVLEIAWWSGVHVRENGFVRVPELSECGIIYRDLKISPLKFEDTIGNS